MARGRKPKDPAHGAMTPTERSARRRAALAEQAKTAIDFPSEAHNLPGVVLVRALQGQLAQLDADSTASLLPAAATLAAIARRYRLPVEPAIDWDFSFTPIQAARIESLKNGLGADTTLDQTLSGSDLDRPTEDAS